MEMYTDKLINEAVNEEMGISDEVSQLAWKLAIAIKENAFKKEKKKIASGVSTNVFLFNLKPFGAELQLKAHITFFGDRKIYAEYRSRNRKSPNVYRKENRTLDMFFDFIS